MVPRSRGVVLVVLVVLLAAPRAQAKLLPSFEIISCSWNATHIVLASQGVKLDGNVTVLESWKGDLKKGDKLTVPELAAFAAKDARAIRSYGGVDPKLPTHVSGTRLLLFLKKMSPDDVVGDPPTPTEKIQWANANRWGGINVSFAWVEEGKLYAVMQIQNPGPAEVHLFELTEDKARTKVLEICKAQAAVQRASTFPAAVERIEALIPLLRTDLYQARAAALNALGECGDPAVPALRKLLRDDSLAQLHGDLVRTLVQAEGARAGPDLVTMVREEMAFWKKTAPDLRVGWWNGTGIGAPQQQRLQNRYSKVLQALYALQKLPCPECRQPVSEFRDFWRSLPQLEDRTGLNQMSEACDVVLKFQQQ